MAATRLLPPSVRLPRSLLPQLLLPVVALAVLVAPAPAAAAAAAAPPLAAPLLDENREFDSRALIGKKVLVLRFQGSWCKTCTAQAPGIQRLAEKYRDRDVEVIGVHVNDTAAEARLTKIIDPLLAKQPTPVR